MTHNLANQTHQTDSRNSDQNCQFSNTMMEAAYRWLCKQRLESSHNNSIWELRYNWITIKPQLQNKLREGLYFLSPLKSYFKLKMHPDKTYIGCIKKGFDFLGAHFGALPTIAKASMEKHRAKLAQRHAQGASPACIGDYMARWTSWCRSVLRASNCTNHNQTNLLERCIAPYQWSMESNDKERDNENISITNASIGAGDWPTA